MAKETLKDFIKDVGHIDAKLIRAVVSNMSGWEAFKESAHDVTNHGAASGFGGFIYYADTVKFTKRNKKEILALAKELADSCGMDGVISFIKSFNCLNDLYSQEEVADGLYNPKSEDQTQIYNALAWFALEEVARAYTDWTENH